MDPDRERIKADLRGVLSGDVLCEDHFLHLYATDASLYEIKPLAVVRPRSTKDVSGCLQYARENRIPVHARGGGTGLAGESLGPGLILDFSAYMRRMIRMEGDTVRVQPGLVHAHLNDLLAPQGRIFGPDPSMSRATTLGSMIAIDASGSHWLKYGSARTHVRSLQVVLDSGEVVEFGREPVNGNGVGSAKTALQSNADPAAQTETTVPRPHEIVSQLANLLERDATLIERKQPPGAMHRCGYRLEGILQDSVLDVAKLLSGSEGTLAIVTEATLATQALPRAKGLAVLLFERLESALLAVQDLLPLRPAACDLLDRRHVSLARENYPSFSELVPASTEALLLVECDGDDAGEVRSRVAEIVELVQNRRHLAFESRQAFDSEEIDRFWQLAHRVVPTLHRMKGTARPVPFIEDVCVPPAALVDFLPKMQNVLKRRQVIASLYGHVGHGQLHLRPFLDLSNPDDVAKIEGLASDLYEEVQSVGGTISGEHGDGLSRTPFIRQQYGELYHVFRAVKRIFDPENILNPGKIIADEQDSLTKYIRPSLLKPPAPPAHGNGTTDGAQPTATAAEGAPGTPVLVDLQLDWTAAEMERAAARCNGCGACRVHSTEVRMCPIFHLAPVEEASPRAKANLVRGLFDGHLPQDAFSRDEIKQVADLCVNCHMCRVECPANVDIPKLMMEVKGAYVADNGLSPSDWLLARLDWYGAVGGLFGPLANWALANRPARWLLERVTGIAQGRKLPRFAKRNFLRRAARSRHTRPVRRSGQKVAYFVDTYATYHDPQLAEALVAVLEHNGIAVFVPPGQRASGMALVSQGALEPARRLAQRNVALLADAVRQGYHIITTEPTAALCLSHEYPNLLSDDDTKLVANNTSEACTYLWELHRVGKLQLDLSPVHAAVAYHLPCHLKALGVGTPGESLMRLIPGLSVTRVEKGCSGMAGTYGLKRENFRNSIRAGWGLISALRSPRIQFGATECSACKMQMEQGTSKPTIQPLKLLALSYGLMPEIGELLSKHGEELIVT